MPIMCPFIPSTWHRAPLRPHVEHASVFVHASLDSGRKTENAWLMLKFKEITQLELMNAIWHHFFFRTK